MTWELVEYQIYKIGYIGYTFASKSEVERFYHYIYDNATIYLKRKKDKFVLPSIANVNECSNGLLGSKIGEVAQ